MEDQASSTGAGSGGPSLVVVDEGASSDLITGSGAVGPSASSASMRVQIVHGRIYRTAAEVREAVDMFVDLYNDQWLPEKNGFISPSATREAWYAWQAQEVAA